MLKAVRYFTTETHVTSAHAFILGKTTSTMYNQYTVYSKTTSHARARENGSRGDTTRGGKIFRFPPRVVSPRGSQFPRAFSWFTRFTIPEKDNGLLVV